MEDSNERYGHTIVDSCLTIGDKNLQYEAYRRVSI